MRRSLVIVVALFVLSLGFGASLAEAQYPSYSSYGGHRYQYFQGYGSMAWYPYQGALGGGYWGRYGGRGFDPYLYGNGQPMTGVGRAEVAAGLGANTVSSILHRQGRHGWADVVGVGGQIAVIDGMRRREEPQVLAPPEYLGQSAQSGGVYRPSSILTQPRPQARPAPQANPSVTRPQTSLVLALLER
jgi:hypothetical protein